jgi:sarcosine oxidase, subunit beta
MADLEAKTDGLSRNGNSPHEAGVEHSFTTGGTAARPPLQERFSWMSLLRHGLSGSPWKRVWRDHELRPSYDVVIIGGGVHGLATAYYLAANHSITNIAVLEKSWLGGGNSGRNTAIIRANYLTPEGVRFYDRSVKLYEELSAALNFNVMFSQIGHLTLAHTDSSLRTMRWRAEVNKLQGVKSEVIGPADIKKIVPYLDVSENTRYPILGALYHLPGGIIRHDAVNWGYARGADAFGVHIHQNTEVTGIDVERGRVTGVRTSRGNIATGAVLNATAGWCSVIADMAGVDLPIESFPLQAAVTEPVQPFLDAVVVSASLHAYVSQTERGELVLGASVDPFSSYSIDSTLEFTEEVASNILGLMPALDKVRILRQWAGTCDMTPDFSPVMGPTPVAGFYVDVGWGTYGFKAGPVAGETMAQCITTGRSPELIAGFGLDRFERGELMGEKGAASVGH